MLHLWIALFINMISQKSYTDVHEILQRSWACAKLEVVRSRWQDIFCCASRIIFHFDIAAILSNSIPWATWFLVEVRGLWSFPVVFMTMA